MASKWRIDFNYNNNVAEITPVNDDQEHFLSCFCDCDPTLEHLEDGGTLIVHHSFDGREAVEWAEEIIANHKPFE